LSRTAKYAGACLALVAAVTVGAAMLVDPRSLFGVLAAAAVALPIQVGAFALLASARAGTNRFLAAWVGGTLVRLTVVGLGGWALIRAGLPRAPTLLGLAGFFFVMLLLEPVFLGLGRTRQTGDRGSR
jgi:hypothetical protein